MHRHATAEHHRAAARTAARIRRWPRRLPARLHTGDAFARQAGWTITPARFGGRIYRDPRFTQPTLTHAPRTPPRPPCPPQDLARPVAQEESP